ncbi:DUF5134 domain-containing protein [Streptomyces sp. MMS24-I2-30]|uniref:DUF5134 domain-containing protein n=1 Tax=Streptomyces sp. MMS24-I2-30 TaxID=3351564 RepID=UPI00389685EC
MAWPWGMNLSTAPQVVLFSAGALWFLAAAPFRSGDRARHRAALAACPHALMMGAMAWMAAAMDSSGAMAGHSGSGGGMPGTDMSGGTGIAAMSLTGNGPRTAAGLLAVALAVIGPAWPAAPSTGHVPPSTGHVPGRPLPGPRAGPDRRARTPSVCRPPPAMPRWRWAGR